SDTTAPLPVNASAVQVESALNNLATLGGEGGSVTVTQVGNVYTVTFGGTLSAGNLALMTPGGTAAAVVNTLADGIDSTLPMYIGSIVMDPTNAKVLYIGTGETNNSTDAFYGT